MNTQKLFRNINAVIEPAVRRGLFSPRYAPTGLISLESTGFKSGLLRRTPLLATSLAGFTVVSTVRGDQSFWVKNLIRKPRNVFSRGGRTFEAEAIVIRRGACYNNPGELPLLGEKLLAALVKLLPRSMAVAVLIPVSEAEKTRS